VPTSIIPRFLQAGCPSCRPTIGNQQCKSTEGHYMCKNKDRCMLSYHCNCLELQENASVGLSQLANLHSQTHLPTGIFHCQISQIWRCSKAFGSKNYRLALNGENHLAAMFAASLEIGWVTSKPCNGKMVSRTKTSGEKAHR